jgi:hypothetical protein
MIACVTNSLHGQPWCKSADTQKLDFTVGNSGTMTQVSFATTTTAATNAINIVTAINNNGTLRDAGVFAINTGTRSDCFDEEQLLAQR